MGTEVVLEDIFGDAPYRKLVEAIHDFAVLHLDREGRIVSWNAGAAALFGHSEAEMIGKPYASIFTSEDQHSGVPERELKEVVETGRAEGTRWHPRRDATRFYANSVITALLDENGSLHGFAKVARDDTARKQMEIALNASEVRYRRLFEAAYDGILILNAETGQIADVNPFLCRLLNYPKAEFMGKELWEIGLFKDKEASQAAFRELQATGYIRYEDMPLETNDGVRREVEFISNVYREGDLQVIQCNIRDITDRKRAESELQTSQERYRFLAEVMPQLVWLTDENGSHFYYNRRWYEYTGLSEEESLGFGIANALHPDDKARALKRWEQAWQNGEGYEIEYRLHSRPLNEYRWFLGRAMPIRDVTGRIVQWVGTCTDIDEQKRAEEKIKKSETSLANAQRIAHIGNWEQNFITDELHWSDEIFRIFGVEPQQFPATSEDFFRHVHPEDVELVKRSVAHAIHNHTSYEIDHRVIRPDNSVRWVHEHAEIYRDGDEQAVKMIGTVQDITERKAAEESIRFQAHLLNTVEQSVIATDLDGIVIYWNQFARELYGWTAQEALGRQIMELTTPEVMTEEAIEIMSHLRQGESWSGEFNVQRRDGTTFPAQIINSPINDDKGELVGIIGVSTDITERKKVEASLTELTHQLERQARVFNTTLSSITDFAYIFDRDGRFVYANQALLDLWGLRLDDAVGKDFFDLQYPDDLASRLQQQIQQVFDTRQGLRDETPYTSPTGASGYYEYIFTPVITSDGAVEVVAGSTREISERKQIETALRESRERLQMAMNVAKIYSWEMNIATRQVEWSNNLERVVGFHLPSDFAMAINLVHPEDREETARLILQAFRDGEDYESEFRLVNPKSGEIVWMRAQGVLVGDAQNSQQRFVGITQNITERKHTEILLDTQKQALEMVVGGSPLVEVLNYLAGIVEHQSARSSIASILLLDGQGRLHAGAAPSLPEDYIQAIEGLMADESVGTCSAAAATSETIISPDIAADPKWQDLKHLPLGLGLQAAWSLPIMAADKRVLGTFGTYFREKREPTTLERQTVEILAKTAALAIERNQAEEALRDAHERIINIFESITDCFYALDADWRFTYVNPQAEAYFNRPKETMLGRVYMDLFPLVRGSESLDRLQEAMSEHKPVQFEVLSPTTGRWIDLHAFPSERGLSVYFRDITERKRAEEELNASEERLRTIFEASRDGILVEDDEHIVYVNESYARLLGYEAPEELIGKHVSSIISAEDTERLLGFGKSRARGKLPASVYEFKGKRKDGTLIEVEASVSASSVAGHSYITTIVRDITARKRAEERLRVSEERFRATFEQANVGIVQLSFDGKFVTVNPGFCKIVGYTEAECQNLAVRNVTHPGDWEFEEAETRRLLSGEISGYSIEKRYLHKNGSIVWGQMTASLVRRGSGEPFYTLAIIEDITERKLAEAELKEINEQLEGRVIERTAALSETNDILQEEVRERRRIEAERIELLRRVIFAQEDERRRIAREMHDQFGQTMSALTLKLATLKEESGVQVKLREQLETLEAVANQLDADVDFLVWELRPTVLDDLGLPAALKAHVQNWSKHFEIPAELHISGMKRIRLTGEIETVLYRITQEALNNIAKHARAAKVDIILEYRENHVSLIIEDDGAGFDVSQAFGPNEKGLGLIGMRERAALVGGTLEIESHPDKGTTVFIRIPAPWEGGQDD